MAIDGPSGTGKSTVARRVAAALHAGYLDTGAIYRTATLAVLRAGIDPDDAAAVAAVVTGLTLDPPVDPERQRHLFHGDDVSTELRGQAVTTAVTPVSANPAVRAHLLAVQQRLAHSGRMVVEGRDIGTVVAPDAALKIYLTADAHERARRRLRQDEQLAVVSTGVTGANPDRAARLAAVASDLDRRDTSDSSRAVAPLQAAADAVLVDSSDLEPAETVRRVLGLAAERGIR
ncbi:(d)CMP kinase [Nakamurella leprariae]|uniref:(d)CMP kinase n=1 Tax=Nakamurella leprariae TaxID=2803911 RepID=UPI0038B3ED71